MQVNLEVRWLVHHQYLAGMLALLQVLVVVRDKLASGRSVKWPHAYDFFFPPFCCGRNIARPLGAMVFPASVFIANTMYSL